jgi:hypothetical protein
MVYLFISYLAKGSCVVPLTSTSMARDIRSGIDS